MVGSDTVILHVI